MASTLTDPVIGSLIDSRYHVRARIARGGMATVYLAHDRRLDREVAIKIMHPHLAEGTDVVSRFRREARAAARLTHPGVVGVFDQGSDGELSYLTMEYVDGHNLRRELRGQGAFTLREALSTVAAILDALGAAHRARLVHRDIKPENVLLAREGGLKVADFGLARAVTEATAASTGNLLGTVAYLSPEIITSGLADARADVYAVGILLYELLSSTPPYQGENPIQVAYQHVHEDIPSIRDVEPWIPAEVDDLISRLCAREPQQRPADGVAAHDLVRGLLASLPEEILDQRAEVDGADHADPEDETIAIVNAGTAALPIGAVSHATVQLPDEMHPIRKRRRRRRWAVFTILLLLIAGAGVGSWWYFSHGPGAFTTVPNVTGEAEGQATSILSQSRLHADVENEYSDDVPLGHVIRTDPGEGEQIRYEATVTLVVSEGIRMIEMPDLAGLDEDGIRGALAEVGWDGNTLDISNEWSRDVNAGEFLSSQPAAGDQISHGEDIAVIVSNGPQPVTIRSVVGQEQDKATAELEEQNLKVVISEDGVFSDSIPEGFVAGQSPEESATAHEGDTVTLTISKGPELVEVPSVTLKQYKEAKEILEDGGFVVEREDLLGGIFGTVRFQDPEPGTRQPKGTTITLSVI